MDERGARPAPITLFEASRPPATPIRRGAGSMLSIPIGNIAGDFRAVTLNRRRRTATYELMVANETHGPLATFTYAVARARPGDAMTWNAITVPPLSSIAITVDFGLPKRGIRQRVVAELHAIDAHLTLEADPPKLHPQGIARRFAIVATGFLLFSLGAGAYAAGRPQVVALAAPAEVAGGKPFSVAYALGPLGNAEYTVETPDGVEIRHGRLPSREGAFDLQLPAKAVTSGYDLRLVASNRLGDSVRVAHIVALAPQFAGGAGGHHAHIYKMALQQDEVRGGEPIVLDYKASGATGTVKLLDQDGTVRAEALLNHRGNSILIAPYVEADQDFRVVLQARRGLSRAESSVALRILRTPLPASDFASSGTPGNVPAPIDPAQPPEDVSVTPGESAAPPIAAAPPGTKTTGPIAVPTGEFTAGSTIAVQIVRPEKGLRVSLVSPLGEEVAGIDVQSGQQSLTFPAPQVATATKYMIVATYARGYEQETVIRPIVVRAR
jgi:hypothetical protein